MSLKRLISLYLEDARLGVSIKLTRLIGSILLTFAITLLGFAVLLFTTIAVADEIKEYLGAIPTYLSFAGFYVLLIAILYAFRRKLIFNPLARQISRNVIDHEDE